MCREKEMFRVRTAEIAVSSGKKASQIEKVHKNLNIMLAVSF